MMEMMEIGKFNLLRENLNNATIERCGYATLLLFMELVWLNTTLSSV